MFGKPTYTFRYLASLSIRKRLNITSLSSRANCPNDVAERADRLARSFAATNAAHIEAACSAQMTLIGKGVIAFAIAAVLLVIFHDTTARVAATVIAADIEGAF